MTDRILRLPEVKTITGFGRSSIYRLAKAGKFPKPIKLGERASGWHESEILRWIEERTTASRGAQK